MKNHRIVIEHNRRKEVIGDLWRQQSTQDWPAYNLAQTKESLFFDILLRGLLETVKEPEYEFGRPSLALKDVIYCTVNKVRLQMSCRRAKSFIDVMDQDYLTTSPNFAMPSRFLNKKKATRILTELVKLSALPLIGIEKTFAVDSTGLRTTNFGPYMQYKHKVSRNHKWVKLHLCIGTRTHIITSVVITGPHAADIKQFLELVKKTGRNFDIEELSADKAYSSRKAVDLVYKLGGQPLIPFKSNATGESKGTRSWHKLYHYFKFRQEEFLAKYHRRSNVEAAISSLKAKLGDSLRSRNFTAQVNETLVKCLAYNLTVLIQSMIEVGINPSFEQYIQKDGS